MMTIYKQYRRKQIAELTDWRPGFDMSGVSVSEADKAAGSPKLGDKIARNPSNHADRWLIAADYFAANFEPLAALQQREGWKWVPVEPTEKMLAAAEREWDGRMSFRSTGAWKAMLAAAPDSREER